MCIVCCLSFKALFFAPTFFPFFVSYVMIKIPKGRSNLMAYDYESSFLEVKTPGACQQGPFYQKKKKRWSEAETHAEKCYHAPFYMVLNLEVPSLTDTHLSFYRLFHNVFFPSILCRFHIHILARPFLLFILNEHLYKVRILV